jgi:DnaJ like chaperone protein
MALHLLYGGLPGKGKEYHFCQEDRELMGWFGKIMFGSMGLMVGGPLGAIAGAAIGHHLFDKGEEAAGPRRVAYTEQNQAAYFVTMFAILGKLAKIDGVVTREEIAVADHFIDSLGVSDRERHFAKQIFNQAKDSNYSIDDFALQFQQISVGQPSVLISFLDVLLRIAAADGNLHPAEESALKRIQEIFQINDDQFSSMKGIHFDDVDGYYRVLNCTKQSSDEEIKLNYKKLVKDFHPDKIMSKGLPEEFTEFATKRFREIQEAYEKVREARKF